MKPFFRLLLFFLNKSFSTELLLVAENMKLLAFVPIYNSLSLFLASFFADKSVKSERK